MTTDAEISDILAGIDIPPAKPARAKKVKAAPVAEKSVPAVEEPAPRGLSQAERVSTVPLEGWPVIILDEDPSGSNNLFVGINGVGFQIQRGIEVAVPPEVLEVLNNAVATRTVQTSAGRGEIESRKQNYSAVPYRIVRFGKG